MGVFGCTVGGVGIVIFQVVKDRGYNGPRKTAQCLSEQIPDLERKSYKILDVGAGTGLVGEEVKPPFILSNSSF